MKSALAVFVATLPVMVWGATPEAPGVPNFHQVNESLYRGAQPVEAGWASLAKLGVKTVIDLRRENEDNEHSTARERSQVQAAGMKYIHFPMAGGPGAPSPEQISQVLSMIKSEGPVFVHCKKGMDRTGVVVACYRMQYEGWKNQKALDEANSKGLHWYEVGMKGFIRSFRPATTMTADSAGLN